MEIIDISWPITSDITAYKDKKIVEISHLKTFENDNVRESKVMLGAHTGTHVDSPSHFLKDGSNNLDLNSLIGRCKVLDLTHVENKITEEDLKSFDISDGDIVLLKTVNSDLGLEDAFNYNFVFLDSSGGEYLASKNVKAVGIDYLGIERGQPDHQTHIALLSKNIPIIEGLRLAGVVASEYTLYCLPLKLVGMEAAPARAVLIK